MLKHSTFEKPKMQFSNSQQEYYSFNTILRITSWFRCLYNVHWKNWLVQLITYNGGDTTNNAVTQIVINRFGLWTMRHKGHQGLYYNDKTNSLSIKRTAQDRNLSPMQQKRNLILNLSYFGPSLSFSIQSKSNPKRSKEKVKEKAIIRNCFFLFHLGERFI